MVFFNYALRKLNAKIVYYGPGLCGKTTNLEWIHDHFEGGKKGNMLSLATEGDRTIFFDLLPLDIGTIRGMEVTLQLYTVPGQVHYNSTRQLVLRGADGVVFVADSQRAMLGSNLDSWKNLKENLLLQGVELASFPHVIQFNKRDLADIAPVEQLDSELNEYSAPIFEAVAIQGIGVQETLEGIVKLVMRSLKDRYEAEFARSATPTVSADVASFQAPAAPPTLHPAATAAPPPMGGPPAVPTAAAPAPPAGVEPEVASSAPAVPPPPEEVAAPVDYSQEPEAETHPGIAAMSLSSEDEPEEKEPTLVIQPEEIGLPAQDVGVGDVELESGALETADLETDEEVAPALVVEPDETADAGISVGPPDEEVPGVLEGPSAGAGERDLPEEPDVADAGPRPEYPAEEPAAASPAPEPVWHQEASPVAGPEPDGGGVPAAGEVLSAESPAEEPASGEAGPGEEMVPDEGAVEVPEAPDEVPEASADEASEEVPVGTDLSESPEMGEGLPLGAAPGEEVAVTGLAEGPVAAQEEMHGSPVEGPGPDSGDPFGLVEPRAAGDGGADSSAPEPVGEESGAPFEPESPTLEQPSAEEMAPAGTAPEPAEAGSAEPEPVQQGTEPFTVWDGDPFGDLAPPSDAAVPTVLAPVEAQAVTGREGQNQLRLQLEGTGALAEYGQVRELDIVVPVPGDWIGGQKVTLQFRLTLVPRAEEEEEG